MHARNSSSQGGTCVGIELRVAAKNALAQHRRMAREPEFDGSTAIVLRPENLEAIKDVRYMSLYHNKLRSFDFSETVRHGEQSVDQGEQGADALVALAAHALHGADGLEPGSQRADEPSRRHRAHPCPSSTLG